MKNIEHNLKKYFFPFRYRDLNVDCSSSVIITNSFIFAEDDSLNVGLTSKTTQVRKKVFDSAMKVSFNFCLKVKKLSIWHEEKDVERLQRS